MSPRRKPTIEGLRRCAEFLTFCLSIGWSRESLDLLERLWWEDHDHNGNLIDRSAGA
jgi:hypothetical protein